MAFAGKCDAPSRVFPAAPKAAGMRPGRRHADRPPGGEFARTPATSRAL